MHTLLAQEKFEDATARAQQALDSATGTAADAARRQLDALDLLIDSTIVQRRFIDDAVEKLNQRARDLTQTLYGEKSRRMAKRLMVDAIREQQLARMLGADAKPHLAKTLELINQGIEVAKQGTGELSAVDEARLYLAASICAQDRGKEDEAIVFSTRSEQLLHHPRNLWEQRWRVPVLSELGATQERRAKAAAGLANSLAASELALHVAGRQSLLYADAMTLLGQFQFYTGDYAAAASNFPVAIGIYRSHPLVVSSAIEIPLFVLAHAVMEMGEYERARPLFEDVLARTHDDAGHFGANYPAYLNSFAMLEQRLNNIDHARALLKQAMALVEQARGESSPILLPILCNLGDLELTQGNIADAERYFQRASEISKANGDAEYWAYFVHFGQGSIALANAHPKEAEVLIADAITKLKGISGEQDPGMLELRCSHALALARMGKMDEAYNEAEALENYRVGLLQRIVPALDESSAIHVKEADHKNCGGLLLALAEQSHDSAKAVRAWELIAKSRGLITNFRSLRLAAARNAATPREKELWSKWQAAARAYAKVLLNGGADGKELKAADGVLEKAEADLGARSLTSAGLLAHTAPLAALLAGRPADSAFVAYIKEEGFDIDPKANTSRARGHVLYALVVDGATTRLLKLGDSDVIGSTIGQWYSLLRQPRSDGDASSLQAAGKRVRAAIWDPLTITHAASRVFAVPDDAVFRVNFAALPDADGFLVERGWRFHILEREEDLALLADAKTPDRLLLLGDPDFGKYAASTSKTRLGLCDSGFSPLPGSATEIDRVARLWYDTHEAQPDVLKGSDASKTAMEQALKGAGMLHLATHTLTLGEQCSDTATSRGVELTTASMDAKQSKGEAALALAGANSYLEQDNPGGILTSQEVLSLALDRMQWVVLSACDTGLGDVINGEGVFGLRRAFRLAGARTVIMSLWKVDDDATAEWMENLYRLRLKTHLETPEALAQADLAVLLQRRASGKSTHPYYWAGFIAAGDWH